jgi:ERO1-like protein alpha
VRIIPNARCFSLRTQTTLFVLPISDKNTNLLSGCTTGHWGPNIDELNKKFSPERTNGEGPQWIRNLYFLYLVELRALAKASLYLEQEEYYTGNEREDAETRKAVLNFLQIVK